jgi:hypothetical protein
MSNNAEYLIALIGGAAIGAGLGILFAPAKEIKLELKLVMVIGGQSWI